jgi:hypothetical protein
MPAVHGFVLKRLLEQAPDVRASRPFFRRMFEKVLHLHRYLYTYRDPGHTGLAFICHPWESGMDNLPSWEVVFESIDFDPEKDVPPYERLDLQHVDAPFRPRKASYDRYIFLVDLLRKSRYRKPDLWHDYPFQVQEPLFNAVLRHSNEAMLELGAWLGKDTGQLREWHEQTNRALNARLWDELRGQYVSFDRMQRKQVPVTTMGGLMPLLCGAPGADRARRMVALLTSAAFAGTPDNPAWLCPSTALTEPGFDPQRYWRGPVWINMNWMLYHGLQRYGRPELADRLRHDALELVRRHGFWEYYNPWKNQSGGCGSDRFSWTAALVLDWLR